MRKVLVGFVLSFILLSVSAYAQDYYVDATGGDDSNNGTSPDHAWQTINKVNKMSFSSGDNILFKRGEIWKEMLRVPSPGTSDNPITFDAYGTGNKPIITAKDSVPNWENSSSWTQHSNNVWYTSLGLDPHRIWLSGTEYKRAKDVNDINPDLGWYWDENSSRVYVYAASNPALTYSNVEGAGVSSSKPVAISTNRKNYLTFRNLDIRGGLRAMAVGDSDGVIIEDCNIGYDSNWGINVYNLWGGDQKFGIVRGCTFDSNCRLSYDYGEWGSYKQRLTYEGITLTSGSHYWEIHNNTFKNWHHAAVAINCLTEGNYTTRYNKVHDNYITAPDIESGRAFGTQGAEGRCSYNEFYRNLIVNVSRRTQIGGDHNSLYYNIIDTMTNPRYVTSGNAQGISLEVWDSGISLYNKIYNNVIYNTDEEGIRLSASGNGVLENNEIKNNILINCSKNPKRIEDKGIDFKTSDHTGGGLKGNTFQNNIFYSSGLFNIVLHRGTIMSVSEFNSRDGQDGDVISDNIQIDPKFMDILNRDFHLQPTSHAIDAGIDVGLTLDFEGTPVPQGNASDIGAYEYAGEKIECYQGSDCGTDPCKVYTCSNPGTPSASCSSQDITSCVNNDGCCLLGCTEQNDNDCINPTALYHFNEGSETFASDSSGNHKDGTIYGAKWTTGISGKALEFDGDGDYVELPSILGITGFSLEAWINVKDYNHGRIIGRDSNQILWKINDNGLQGFIVKVDGNQYGWNRSSSAVPKNEWHHVAVTYDSSDGGCAFFLDGQPDGSGIIVSGGGDVDDRTIAYIGTGGGYDFNGTIDEVRIYNRALTPEEILEHYNELRNFARADLDDDGFVDIIDLGIITTHFGQTQSHQDWNATADVVPNYEIDVFDVVFVASRFT
jgi:parallel beta-helix repeat protein